MYFLHYPLFLFYMCKIGMDRLAFIMMIYKYCTVSYICFPCTKLTPYDLV